MKSKLTKLVIELELGLIGLSFFKANKALLASLNKRRYSIIIYFGFHLVRKKR